MKKLKNNKIIKLAIPATIENILQTLVGFIDALMIAKIGLIAVTAVGVANTILNVYLAIFIAIGIGGGALIAQRLGAKNEQSASELTNQTVLITIIFGLLFGIISICFGELLLKMMGASNEILSEAMIFFYIVGGTAVFIALMTVFGSILRANEDTKTPMQISIIVNLINIIIDYLLIFGVGPIPPLGVIGTAIGTVISRIIGSYLLFHRIQQSKSPIRFKILFAKKNYQPLIRLIIPATLERLVMRFGQVIYFGLIVSLSAKTFASHSIAGNIESFTYMPAYGLAAAASTIVGNQIGANKMLEAKQTANSAVKFGVITMSFLGIILFLGAPYFALLFTNDAEAIQQIVIALRIDAFIQPALAVSLITTGTLQGMGDTKTPLISTIVGMWGIRIIGVLVLAIFFKMGIAGIWLAIGIDLYARSIFLNRRLQKNMNKNVKSQS